VGRVREGLEEAENDRAFVATLEEVRLEQVDAGEGGFAWARSALRYAAAFRGHGLDVLALGPGEARRKLEAHPLREELVAALEDWAGGSPDQAERRRLWQVLTALDPDPGSFLNRWRAALAQRDRAALERLVTEAARQDWRSAVVVNLARDLRKLRALPTAVRLLSEAHWRRPNDFWLNFELAYTYQHLESPRLDEAVGHYRVALALRRRSPVVLTNLGFALDAQGRAGEAIRCYRQALALDPKHPAAHSNLGSTLGAKGRWGVAISRRRFPPHPARLGVARTRPVRRVPGGLPAGPPAGLPAARLALPLGPLGPRRRAAGRTGPEAGGVPGRGLSAQG
jgi:tetratricopeptide (TPR) repeat protein